MTNTDTYIAEPEDALLATMRQDIPAAHPSTLTRARRELLTRAVGGEVAQRKVVRARRSKRSLALRLTASAAAFAVAGVGLQVVTARSVGSSAEAAAVLNATADAIIASDAKVGPNQYTYHRSESFINGKQDSLIEVWVPGDDSKPWVLRRAEQDGFYVPHTVKAKNGDFYGPGDDENVASAKEALANGYWHSNNPSFFAALPRDPEQLMAILDKSARNMAGSTDQGITENAGAAANAFILLQRSLDDALRPAPADLRAAFLQVAAKIPGVTVDRNAEVNGQPAVTMSFTSTWGRIPFERKEISFNPENGQVVSVSATVPGAAGALMKKLGSDPEDQTLTRSVEVVDTAPTQGSRQPCTTNHASCMVDPSKLS